MQNGCKTRETASYMIAASIVPPQFLFLRKKSSANNDVQPEEVRLGAETPRSADPAAPLTRNAPGARISRSFVMQAADLSTCQQSLPTASYLPTDRWARSVVMKVISHPESHTVATLS